MIHIDRVIIRRIKMDLIAPFETSSATVNCKEILILEIYDKSGISVFSECVAKQTPNYLPETVDTSMIIIKNHILPLIMHQTFDSPEVMTKKIKRHIRGNFMAVAAFDMAAWAILSEQKNIALSQVIGGTSPVIDCGISIGIQSSKDILLDKVKQEVALGYKKIKLKIKPDKDIEYIKYLRDSLGYDAPLMVDANNAYTLDDIDKLKQLDQLNLMMIEQPLAWDDIGLHVALQKELRTPICLDESILTEYHAQIALSWGAARIINIKPGRVGGFSEAIKIHDLAKKMEVPVWCGGMLETGIGRAYNVALASLNNFSIPGDISPSKRYWKEDIVEPEWTMLPDGTMNVPVDKPGLGVNIKLDMLESITLLKEDIS